MPDFVIRTFRVPIFLLPIYQAAGIEYGIRWEVLAAINEIETDYGRNLNVSSAGALGWMQFLPSSWRAYGVDANEDGVKDPYNPVDAIFAAARYLDAAGYRQDARRAIFAYNHADWYVDSVMLRARLIASAPPDLIASLTGLTEGRFPVAARTHRIEPSDDRHALEIFARQGARVVAVNDGVITEVGTSATLGRTSCSGTCTATATPTRTSARWPSATGSPPTWRRRPGARPRRLPPNPTLLRLRRGRPQPAANQPSLPAGRPGAGALQPMRWPPSP